MQGAVDIVHGSDPGIEPSAATTALYAQVARVAPSPVSVLVQGETGAGKERVVQALHEQSGRSGPLLTVNCGALPDTLIEAELFGHERGAFTGASERRCGYFERAHRGTVCLDEIGELSPSGQAALLRVLETKRFCRVGGTTEISVDVRVVAATHRDLAAYSRRGLFRSDLYYRLGGCTLHVSPLRERPEEIVPLARSFLLAAARQARVACPHLDEAAARALQGYSWPGNVRELINAMQRAAALCDGGVVTEADLPAAISEEAEPSGVHRLRSVSAKEPMALRDKLKAYEAQLISAALRRADGHRGRAARSLGLPLRTFQRKLRDLAIA